MYFLGKLSVNTVDEFKMQQMINEVIKISKVY